MLKVSGEPLASISSPIAPISYGTPVFFKPTYHIKEGYVGSPGDTIVAIFDNAYFFADDMTFKLGDVVIEPFCTFTVQGTGFGNAFFGAYKIPEEMSVGIHTILVTDQYNVEYLPEDTNKFTIQ